LNAVQKTIDFIQEISADSPIMSTFADHRKASRRLLIRHGFPTHKDEAWRFTNIQPLINQEYDFSFGNEAGSQHMPAPVVLENVHHLSLHPHGKIDQTSLSEFTRLTGCFIQDILGAEQNEQVKTLFSTIIRDSENSFTALNATLFDRGYVIVVPDNIHVDKPIHIQIDHTLEDRTLNTNSRLLMVLGKNAQCTLILSSSKAEGSSFSNMVTEIQLEDNCRMDYYLLQFSGQHAHHMTHTGVFMKKNARLAAHHFSTGGRTIRNDLTVNLFGQGAGCSLRGLILGKNTDQIDNHTLINHLSPNCVSTEVFKGILADRSHGIFNGLVTVFPEAQLTSATQKNHTLLLSRDAMMNSNPQLQINADNVKCSHGSSTGELDEDAEFYIRSRGINEEMAKFMLIQGFAREITNSVSNSSVKDVLQSAVDQYLNEVTKAKG